jgi:hypothetical protein
MPASSSSCSCVNIQIRIVRDNTNSLKDEIFTISKSTHNDWRINHKSAFSATNSTMFLYSRSDIVDYLRNIFTLLKLDDERFEFLQFDIPCHPVVMVSRSDIMVGSQTFFNLVQVVESVLYNWPYDVRHWTAGEQEEST